MIIKPEYIIHHHSWSVDNKTLNWPAIRRYHVDENGWSDIGYHYGIERVGSLLKKNYEILVGRMWPTYGSHCKENGMNFKSIGICWVGNYDKNPPSQKMWELGVQFTRSLMTAYGIPKEANYPHRHFAEYKSCPGDAFDFGLFRSEL